VSIEIRDVRLSFIWVETFLDLLAEMVPAEAPLAFLGRDYTYEPQFDVLLRDNRARIEPGSLSLPWTNIAHQGFWSNYFDNLQPYNGKQCWQALVPLRRKLPATSPPWLPGRLLVESFFYPHGTAIVVTATYEGRLTLEETVLMAWKVRKTGKFPAQWLPGISGDVGLRTLTDKAMNSMRTTALGPAARPGVRSATPFTVLTVVRGSGVDPSVPIPEGGEIHRALEAVTSWSNSWQYDPLPDLDEVSTPTPYFEDLIYTRKRGHAVWFPVNFTSQEEGIHTLSCYHRNLVFASLTVESLVGLVAETARQLDQGRSLSPAHRQCARRASGILGRLYGGANSTYRSWSPNIHIDENEYEDVIDEVRLFFNMDMLD
jgi:hypothetical protein